MVRNEDHLTPNFTLGEFLKTSHLEFQEKNNQVTDEQVEKLTKVAKLLEHIRFILAVPIAVTSGYRCPELNEKVGSKPTSQHMKCEAVDFIPKGIDLGEAFRKIWDDMKDNGTNIGQLIFENQARGGNEICWIHVSVGEPFRDKSDCRQVLRMKDGVFERLA